MVRHNAIRKTNWYRNLLPKIEQTEVDRSVACLVLFFQSCRLVNTVLRIKTRLHNGELVVKVTTWQPSRLRRLLRCILYEIKCNCHFTIPYLRCHLTHCVLFWIVRMWVCVSVKKGNFLSFRRRRLAEEELVIWWLYKKVISSALFILVMWKSWG